MRRGAPAARAVRPRSGQRRAPLRPGDLRGPQGLSPQGRRRRPVPPRAERPPLPGLGRAPGDARPARSRVFALDRGTGEGRRRMGSRRRRQPLSAPVHVRQRDVSGRPSGVGILVRGDRLSGRRLFQGRQEGGHASGSRPTTPAPRQAAPAPPNAAAITPRASSPRRKRSSRAATRSCSSTPPSAAGSKNSGA